MGWIQYERYEPGNGTRYDIVYGVTGDDQPFVAIPNFGKAAVMALHPIEHTYIQEKLGLGEADAKAILKFLHGNG